MAAGRERDRASDRVCYRGRMHRRLSLAVLALVACRGGEGKRTVKLLANVTDPVDLAVDHTGVYLATKDSLVRVPLTGGEPVILARGDITDVAVDPSYIYYVQRHLQERKDMEVHRLDKDGGNDKVVATDWPLNDLASDGAHVYWTGGFRVRRLESDGSVTELAETGVASDLAFDDDHVYYSAGKDDRDLFRVPKSGGRSELQVSNRSQSFSDFAVGGGAIYWIDNFTSVARAPIGGEPGSPVAVGKVISNLAWDRGDLFFIDANEGTIRRVPPAEQPVVIARGKDLWRLAVHGEHVYFVEKPARGQAPVRRVAR